MESMSQEERAKEIMDMIKEDKEELEILALQTIEQMQRDTEEFFRISETNGYCYQSMGKELGYDKE